MIVLWQRAPSWSRWSLLYVAITGAAALVGRLTIGVGNAMFIAGALAILSSVGFIRLGGERGLHVVRDLFGRPVALEEQEPDTRRAQISTGLKIFLLGLALWAPLLYLALR